MSSVGSQGDVASCSQLHANLRPVKLEYPDTQIHSQEILISLIPGVGKEEAGSWLAGHRQVFKSPQVILLKTTINDP